MKVTVFWDVALCSLVEIDRRFRSAYCLHYQALMVEAERTSETPVSIYETTRHNVPEDSHICSKDVSSSETRDRLTVW
jgi:hypothetical protein